MRHYMGIMMPPQESDAWSYESFKGRLVAHMQRSDNWSQPHSVLYADLDRIDPELRENLQPKREAAYLYDAVLLYAQVLHDVITEGGDFRSGREIIDRVKGRVYQSESFKVYK